MADSGGYIYVTAAGRDRMAAELKRLKTVDRPVIVAEISRARDLGDISENAEYHAAKEKQVLIERKISELEEKMMRVRVIEPGAVCGDRAFLFSSVTVRDTKSGEEICYKLVSAEEADIDEDKISIQSPVGRALLGSKRGDKMTIAVPAGTLEYEVIDIAPLA